MRIRNRAKDFWEKYEAKIVLVLAFFLVSVLSFEAGALKSANLSQKPLIIEKPSECLKDGKNALLEAEKAPNLASDAPSSQKTTDTTSVAIPQNCAFLGSKNSDKYHLPTCQWAKRIKPENRVCFSSEDEAKSRGYQADKNCIK